MSQTTYPYPWLYLYQTEVRKPEESFELGYDEDKVGTLSPPENPLVYRLRSLSGRHPVEVHGQSNVEWFVKNLHLAIAAWDSAIAANKSFEFIAEKSQSSRESTTSLKSGVGGGYYGRETEDKDFLIFAITYNKLYLEREALNWLAEMFETVKARIDARPPEPEPELEPESEPEPEPEPELAAAAKKKKVVRRRRVAT